MIPDVSLNLQTQSTYEPAKKTDIITEFSPPDFATCGVSGFSGREFAALLWMTWRDCSLSQRKRLRDDGT
jgi:hypothetical protein